ncbi:MAG: outer membrane beta-barrel protein [Ignavibacteriales bacterium]|nr:outer membrane beta-barrel protein [Ignavibacteriales bacterium]
MKKTFLSTAILVFIIMFSNLSAQTVKIGPRLTGNMNIYNQDGLTGTYSGIGIGIGGAIDFSFNRTIGMLVNLTVFDMKNFSNTKTQGTTTQEQSLTLSYLTIDPLFKAEFSGFYLVGGPSLGVKLNSSGETSTIVTGQAPNIQPLNIETNSVKFDIAVGTGYNFKLAPDLTLGSDFIAYIPLSNTFDTPGISNSTLSLKLGVSIKFTI